MARNKVGGTSLTHHQVKQFPALPPSGYTPGALAIIVTRGLELTCTAHDLQPFYAGVVAENPAWDPPLHAKIGRAHV